MDDVETLLTRIEHGEQAAAVELLPIVYDELRKLAAQRMAQEQRDLTLQATALVHEAFLRLVGEKDPGWKGRGHFFGAAAEAMRRVLIDEARKRATSKRGGDRRQSELLESRLEAPERAEELIELDAALDRLEAVDADVAQLVKLRFHVGLSNKEAASLVGVSPRKADQMWSYARAWLRRELDPQG